MDYLEVNIFNNVALSEIIIAELSSIGYDSFIETEEGVNAYIESDLFNEEALKEVLVKYIEDPLYRFSQLERKNWNEEWEKNFDPIIVENKVLVKASFHNLPKQYPFEIIINPKMSFGTGHHETTYMMIQNQIEINHKEKTIMDAGSGTGILAILASKLGAKHVFAFDIEDWAFENLTENINLNNCNNIKIAQGTIESVDIPFPAYDIILANINKNVLLKEISSYSRLLVKEGLLVLSGFYEGDISDLENTGKENSLKLRSSKLRNKWASMVLEKI